MQLLRSLVVLAICLTSVFAMPDYTSNMSDDAMLEMFVARARSSLIDTRSMSSAETLCANNYNSAVQQNSNQVTNQTHTCYENANKTALANSRTANQTINAIRVRLTFVQQQVNRCLNLTDNNALLNCTTQTFDSNLERLDSANTNSYQVLAQQSNDQLKIDNDREACINTALGHSKTTYTEIANNYNNCLKRIPKQRSSRAVKLLF